MYKTGHSGPVHWDDPRDRMGSEVGEGFRMGTHVHPWLISCECMAKTTTIL